MGAIGTTPKGAEIAAWILKADPKVFSVDDLLDREGVIHRWSVHHSYRSELMTSGQKCLMWRSGPDGAFVAAGLVTGEVEPGQTTVQDWFDQTNARRVHHFAPLNLHPLDDPIERDLVKHHPVLSHIEIMRAPRGSNPSILTPVELAAIEDLLGSEVGTR